MYKNCTHCVTHDYPKKHLNIFSPINIFSKKIHLVVPTHNDEQQTIITEHLYYKNIQKIYNYKHKVSKKKKLRHL